MWGISVRSVMPNGRPLVSSADQGPATLSVDEPGTAGEGSQSAFGMVLLRLLGHPAIERDGARTPIAVRPKAIALAALLTANASRPLAREWLAQALWPDVDPAEGRANLRRHFHLLAKSLGEDALLLTRHTAQWNTACDVSVDLVRFDEFCRRDPVLAIQEYTGDLCTGIDDEAIEALRNSYRFRYEELLRRRMERARSAGDDSELALWLQRSINYDPYDEDALRQIMELRRRHGDRAGALREFNAFAQRLRSELQSEPSAETAALVREIAVSSSEPRIRNNLSNPATTFVGRERELHEIHAAVQASRLVTLVGPGGIGKSRLALRAASDLVVQSDYSDGVWMVALEDAPSEAAAWELMASSLGISATAEPARAVLTALAEARALLVLDTCEHIHASASSIVERLLTETTIRLLATSRRKLGLAAEHAIEVGPLEMPPEGVDGTLGMRFPAYRLFLERATAVNPAFRAEPRHAHALREVLSRTDGLPLAIELVASRANVLTVEGMRRRLSAVIRSPHRLPSSTRAQTIDDTIAWSYDLLAPVRQRAFRRLSLFEGAFDLDDAERLCESDEAVESFFELADASLIAITADGNEARYRLLDTTRTFARTRLVRAEDYREALRAHAELFAEKADGLARAPESHFPALLPRTLADMPNYLAAIDHAVECGLSAYARRIVEGIYRFGARHHRTIEMLSRVQALLADPAAEPEMRARMSRIAGILADSAHRYDDSLAFVRASARLYRDLDDDDRYYDALGGVAGTLFHLRSLDECERILLTVRDYAERAGNTLLYVKTAGRLGALLSGYAAALEALSGVAAHLERIGEMRQAALAYKNIAVAAFFENRHEEVLHWTAPALDLLTSTTEPALRASLLSMRGWSAQQLGATNIAVEALSQALEGAAELTESIDGVEVLEDVAAALEGFGEVETAATLLGSTESARRLLGTSVSERQRSHYYDALIGRLEGRLNGRFWTLRREGSEKSIAEGCEAAAAALRRVAG